MAIHLSLWDHIVLKDYIHSIHTTGHYRGEERLLQRLQQKGIAIKSTDEIETEVSPNARQLKYTDAYLAKRVQGAYLLQEHLDNDAPIRRCYRAIDRLVSEKYEGTIRGEHTKAEEILDSALSYMKDPNQNAYSLRNRAESIPAVDAFFGGAVIGGIEGGLAYQATRSPAYALLASLVGMSGGVALTVYIDSWFNHEVIPAMRKMIGTDEPDAPSILERRLLQKKERYEKLCRLATGI